MHILWHFWCVLFVGQSLAVLTNGQLDLAINKPGVYQANLYQSETGISQLVKDNLQQQSSYQYKGQAPQGPYQHNVQSSYLNNGPSQQNVPTTLNPESQQGPYEYLGASPQNTPPSINPNTILHGPYQYTGPSAQNVAAPSTQHQGGPFSQSIPPTPTQSQHGIYQHSGNHPTTSPKDQHGSYPYNGEFSQNLSETSKKQQQQQGSYLYTGPSAQNRPTVSTQGQQGPFQHKETSPQKPPTSSTQGQQNPFQYSGPSQENQKPLTQTISNSTSQEYPQPQGYHQFNRPSSPNEPENSPQNVAVQSYKPSQKYLPPNSAPPPTEPPQLQTTSDYPRPSQHYLPPTLISNVTSQASSTHQQYYQEYLTTNAGNEKQRPSTSPLPTSATSSSTYHGPDYQYLPATTTPLPSQNSGNYFSNQHWNPIKPDRNRQTTTPIPPNSQGPVALHQGYRYNTPALKQNSSHSQTFNGVIYNELGMGMNTSQYFFVPNSGPSGKTEVETQQGYVYGRPENRLNENLDSVTHLIPVPTMPSSYIYYKPSQKPENSHNLTGNHQQQQELNGNSRPSDYPVQQQTIQEASGNSRPSTDYSDNHNRPLLQEILQQSNGNSKPLTDYPGKQENPSFQQSQKEPNGNSGPSDYANHRKPALELTHQDLNGNTRPSSDYTPQHDRPSLQQIHQESNGNVRPSANHERPSVQQINHNLNVNSRPSSKNPYLTEQYEGNVGDSANGNQQRPRPIYPGTPPPQYSTPEFAGNFRPSTGVPVHPAQYEGQASPNSPSLQLTRPGNPDPSHHGTPQYSQTAQYEGQASPNSPSLQLTRPGNPDLSHQAIPQYSQNQPLGHRLSTPPITHGLPNDGPTVTHIYHHPGAMSISETYLNGNTGKAPSNTSNQNYQSIPAIEPPRYTSPNQFTPSQQVWSQNQGSRVESTQDSFSSNRIPSNSNSLSAAQPVPQGYYLANQLSSPLSGYRPLSLAIQNSQISANSSHKTQTEPQRNHHLPSPSAGVSPGHIQSSEQYNQSYRPDYAPQIVAQDILTQQSNYSSQQSTFPQLSNTPLRPTSSQITFPFNQMSAQDNTNIPPASQGFPPLSPLPSYSHSHVNISPEEQRNPPFSTQFPQQGGPTPSPTFNSFNKLNSNYPSLAQSLTQNLNTPKEFPQQTQQTFLEKPTAAPQVPTPSAISNFFGPSGNVPAGPTGDAGSVNRVNPQHKPMTFVDTTGFQQMPSHSFELPPYYAVIPRNRAQALPQLPPLKTTPAPLVNTNYPLQKPITDVVDTEKKPLVFFRTSIGNSRPNPPPLAKPMVFVESPVVPQASPVRHPHVLYGSPLHEVPTVYLPPSVVVQPPYNKK